jgi:hypothetical protein
MNITHTSVEYVWRLVVRSPNPPVPTKPSCNRQKCHPEEKKVCNMMKCILNSQMLLKKMTVQRQPQRCNRPIH